MDDPRDALERVRRDLLGGPLELTAADVARLAGVGEDEVRAFWQALGLTPPGHDAPAFAATDVRVVGAHIGASKEFDLSPEAGVSLVRAMGHSIERLATWQAETLVEHLAAKHQVSDGQARAMLVDRLPVVTRVLEQGVVHAWRRHLLALAERMVQDTAAPADPDALPLARAVGLADVVGFTRRTAAFGAGALADYLQAFESRARDEVAAAGGRVVKTVGDALLFVADDPATGALVARRLVAALGPDSAAPLRVGLVWGRVLARFGDVFGPPVALAARLCDEAGPGEVLVDEATVAALGPPVTAEPLAPRELSGVGVVTPWRLVPQDG